MKKLLIPLLLVGCSYSPTEPEPTLKPSFVVTMPDTVRLERWEYLEGSVSVSCNGAAVNGAEVSLETDKLPTAKFTTTNGQANFDLQLSKPDSLVQKIRIVLKSHGDCMGDTVTKFYICDRSKFDWTLFPINPISSDSELVTMNFRMVGPAEQLKLYNPFTGRDTIVWFGSTGSTEYKFRVPESTNPGTYKFLFEGRANGIHPRQASCILTVK